MHPYAIDTEERRYILFILAIISILSTWGFYAILDKLQLVVPWWAESPSVLFFYGVYFYVFNNYLWEYLAKIRCIKTPNLKGDWDGYLKSSFDEHSSQTQAKLKIYQTWTTIKLILKTDHSQSHSRTASFLTDAPEGCYLNYEYINEPKPDAAKTMNIHRGVTRLLLDDNAKTLSGDYYSGRGRQNYGSLNFKKASKSPD